MKLRSVRSREGGARGRKREGFVLLEAMVAIVILAIAMSSLAALMVQVSQRALKVSGDAYKNGVLALEIDRLQAIPYDSLLIGSSSVSVTDEPYPHTRTITLEPGGVNVIKIKLLITPTKAFFRPDSATIYRRTFVPTTALNTT